MMAGSLKDQLLKAGLVNKQQVKKAEIEKRKSKGRTPAGAPGTSELARQAQAEKTERDRELNRTRQAEAERKANAAAIKQLIETNRVEKGEGDIAYNFVDGNKVRRVYVTREIHEQLVKGTLCLARLNGRYELVRTDVAEKIRERDPYRVIMPAATQTETPAEDDPYAAYQVPDDLIW